MQPNGPKNVSSSHNFLSPYLPSPETVDSAAIIFGGAVCGTLPLAQAITCVRNGNFGDAAKYSFLSATAIAGLVSEVSRIMREEKPCQ